MLVETQMPLRVALNGSKGALVLVDVLLGVMVDALVYCNVDIFQGNCREPEKLEFLR